MIILLNKNLMLPGIDKLQQWFIGPFRMISKGPGTYHLDLQPSMDAIHPWFHTSFLKPAGPHSSRPLTLEDDSYKVKTILKINKRGTHAKEKWMGYNSSHNQWIKLAELWETASEVV